MLGVKSIVLPVTDAKRIEKYVQETLSNPDINNICDTYKDVLKSIFSSNELKEEVHHFNCLTQSKIASFFHIRNVLLRLAFSNWGKNNLEEYGKCGHRVVRNVLQYFWDYAEFHNIAYGYIEAHHLVLSHEKPSSVRLLYSSKIKSAYIELKEDLSNSRTSQSELDSFVATKVDDLYAKRKKMSSKIETMAKVLLMNEILEPYSWMRIVSVLFRHYKLIPTYVVSRLFPNSKIKVKTGVLPGILSSGITIDPAAFIDNKQYFNSQESEYKSGEDKLRGDLLWYVASRTAVIALFKQKCMTKHEIRIYFKMLRKFSTIWSPKSVEGILQGSHIDNEIVTIMFENNIDPLDGNKHLKKLESIVIRVYLKWQKSNNIDFKSKNSPHKHYFNCTYMHI